MWNLNNVAVKRRSAYSQVLGDVLPVWPSSFTRFAVAMCSVSSMRWMVAGVGRHHESRRERHTVGEVAVHGGAGDAQHFGDVGGGDALVPKLTGFGGVGVGDLAWASALAPVGCG